MIFFLLQSFGINKNHNHTFERLCWAVDVCEEKKRHRREWLIRPLKISLTKWCITVSGPHCACWSHPTPATFLKCHVVYRYKPIKAAPNSNITYRARVEIYGQLPSNTSISNSSLRGQSWLIYPFEHQSCRLGLEWKVIHGLNREHAKGDCDASYPSEQEINLLPINRTGIMRDIWQENHQGRRITRERGEQGEGWRRRGWRRTMLGSRCDRIW